MTEQETHDRTPATPDSPAAERPAPPRPPARGEREGEDKKGGETPSANQPPGEKGGPKGPEPTRFGDWEKNGRCFDF